MMIRTISLLMTALVMSSVVSLAAPANGADAPGTHASAAAADAHAGADAEAHESPGLLNPELGTAVWTIVLFVVLVAVLGKFAWPPILKGLQDREQKIRGDLEGAEKAAREATQTLKQYHAKLAEAHEDSRKLIAEARAEAERAAAQLKESAAADVDQIRQRAQQEIVAAKEQALNELYAHTAALATQVAGRILQREIRPEDQQQLIDESVRQFREAQNN